MIKLFTPPVWCMLGWTVLILSIYVYWCYSDWNREQEWGDYWYGFSFGERRFHEFMILLLLWFCGMALLAIWYFDKGIVST